MKIDRHISELLYDHDCVIVPSFGGFLASYQPAQYQPLHHTFHPPSKKIAFNVFLKNNDGLLANYVAHRNNITYAEALKRIEGFRMDAVKLLDNGKRIIIEDVGTLYSDQHKNLQFEPAKNINHLDLAFGLTAVQSAPVKREEQRKKIERQLRQAVAIRSSVHPLRENIYGKRSTGKKVMNTLLVSGAVLWFAFNVYLITPNTANKSSLNPFSYTPSSLKVEPPVALPESESVKPVVPAEQIKKTSDAIDNSVPAVQPADDKALVLASPPAHEEEGIKLDVILQKQKNFFIIAGVFRDPFNAEKLLITLKQEGFNKAEVVNPDAAVKKVCYSSFAYKRDAVAALAQLRADKKDGWIMAR